MVNIAALQAHIEGDTALTRALVAGENGTIVDAVNRLDLVALGIVPAPQPDPLTSEIPPPEKVQLPDVRIVARAIPTSYVNVWEAAERTKTAARIVRLKAAGLDEATTRENAEAKGNV